MPALTDRVRRIAPEHRSGEQLPLSDAAPDWVAAGTPEPLAARLRATLGEENVALRALDLIRYASDASHYRYIPRAIAIPRDIEEVAAAMALARETSTPLVFRAGGDRKSVV